MRAALTAWLAPENFDAQGRQRRRLEAIRAEQRTARGGPEEGEASRGEVAIG